MVTSTAGVLNGEGYCSPFSPRWEAIAKEIPFATKLCWPGRWGSTGEMLPTIFYAVLCFCDLLFWWSYSLYLGALPVLFPSVFPIQMYYC